MTHEDDEDDRNYQRVIDTLVELRDEKWSHNAVLREMGNICLIVIELAYGPACDKAGPEFDNMVRLSTALDRLEAIPQDEWQKLTDGVDRTNFIALIRRVTGR